MEERGSIDLGAIKEVIVKYKIRLLAIMLVCILMAVTYALNASKEYESTTLLRAKAQKTGGISLQAASALAILGGGAGASPTAGYMELMKSRSVLDPIIASLDLPDERKANMDAKGFAKSNLRVVNIKGTDLLEVVGIGRTPEEAQQISTGVVKSFQQFLTKLNQSEQSLMIKFLNERVSVAKKNMEQAEQNLEKFRQQEKIYIPDEQARAAIEKVVGFDKRLAEQQVLNQAATVRLQGVDEQLQKQNVAIYKYNVADNSSIQQIRTEIISKQMALIDLNQRYTDKHPNVILAKAEIDELNKHLKDEVHIAVSSGTTTLNTTHAGLLSQKVLLETEIMVGQSVADVLAGFQVHAEQDISKLSAGSIIYIGLERQAKTAQEVYGVLIKNYEQTRIQEAMESMDIQIVDEADLPKTPSAPKKVLIIISGGVLGVMLAFVYVMILYSRGSRNAN